MILLFSFRSFPIEIRSVAAGLIKFILNSMVIHDYVGYFSAVNPDNPAAVSAK